MTDPLQSYDRELLKRYDEELQQIEFLPPAAIELDAKEALALITHIQIAAANPAVKYNPLLPAAIAAAKQIQSAFNPESAIYEVLELGWHEPETSHENADQVFTILSTQRPAPYYPDDHDHF